MQKNIAQIRVHKRRLIRSFNAKARLFCFLWAFSISNFKVKFQIKSNLLLYLLNYAEACRVGGAISASLGPGNTASFEEMLQR